MFFEITEHKLTPYKMELDYVYGEYYYNVICDFDWLEDEYSGVVLDFTLKPLRGTYFHETEDESGTIEITESYCEWLQEKAIEFRNNTLWLYEEALEKQRYLDRNEQDWSYYGTSHEYIRGTFNEELYKRICEIKFNEKL